MGMTQIPEVKKPKLTENTPQISEQNTESEGYSPIGQTLPNLELPAVINGEITTFKISELLGKYVNIIFFPHAFSDICDTEINKISALKHKFEEVNCEVIFVSTDSEFVLKAWTENKYLKSKEKRDIKYPLISDYNRELTEFLGFKSTSNTSERASAFIDKDLKIRNVMIYDERIGRNSDEMLRLIGALDYIIQNPDGFCLVD